MALSRAEEFLLSAFRKILAEGYVGMSDPPKPVDNWICVDGSAYDLTADEIIAVSAVVDELREAEQKAYDRDHPEKMAPADTQA